MTSVIKKSNNPWIIFSPFLLLFILIVLKLNNNSFEGDEGRYIMFTHNLLHGFYSPRNELNLWNGPGYPFFLMPFVALKLPVVSMPLANAFLQYFSIVFLYKTLVDCTANKKLSLLFALFWACYYISYQEMPNITTEALAGLLCVLWFYFLQKHISGKPKAYLMYSGVCLGFLVLTKIVFGYVLIFLIGVAFVARLFQLFKKKQSIKLNKVGIVCLVAFITVMPYLFYTYSLTGKFAYFGNSGGMSLYWMSTPYENEFGDWNNINFDGNKKLMQAGDIEKLRKNHEADIKYVYSLSSEKRDDAYKALAIANIKAHPAKYARNCFSNLSRLLFGIPSSYLYQRDVTFVRIIPNAILLALCLGALIIWFYNLRTIPVEINFYLLFVAAYLFFSMLVSAYPRQFYIVVPVLLIWMSSTLNGRVKIYLKPNDNTPAE